MVTPTRNRVINPDTVTPTPLRRPEWIKVRAPSGETYERLQTLMRSKALHTVCEEAMCPNMGECWGSGTATFLMLGDVCTRTCGFCDIKHGKPGPAGLGRAGARGPGGQVHGPEARRHHLRQPRRAPRRRRADLCHGHPPHPRAAAGLLDRGADPRFQGLARSASRSSWTPAPRS